MFVRLPTHRKMTEEHVRKLAGITPTEHHTDDLVDDIKAAKDWVLKNPPAPPPRREFGQVDMNTSTAPVYRSVLASDLRTGDRVAGRLVNHVSEYTGTDAAKTWTTTKVTWSDYTAHFYPPGSIVLLDPKEGSVSFPYTYDEFRDQLLRIQKAHPDRTNPRVDGDGCAYTVPNGSDGVEHCIIGEWLSIHDPHNLPDWDGYLNGSDSDPNYWAADRLFHGVYGVSMSSPVARLAAHVQAQADGAVATPGQLRRSDVAWGEVDIPVIVP